jgi:hypothetical protein
MDFGFLMRFRIINSSDETFNSFIIHFQALKIDPYCSVIQLQFENKADIPKKFQLGKRHKRFIYHSAAMTEGFHWGCTCATD